MEGLRFRPQDHGAADPDVRILSDQDLGRLPRKVKSEGGTPHTRMRLLT
jgi:hypothetical protein